MALATRECKGCGATIHRTDRTGPIRFYCGPECRPRCSIEGCDRPTAARGWCNLHHLRWRNSGSPGAADAKRTPNVGACSVDGCEQPMRHRNWCASHYSQWHATGRDPQPFKFKWADADAPCVNCGAPTPGRNRYCSGACKADWHRRGRAPRPASKDCASCGDPIDLMEVGAGGRRRYSTISLCRRCKQDSRKHGMTVGELAQRDGTDCGICGGPVDMSLRKADSRMCASIDHIVPRAHGGTNDPANLQLAHLQCNAVKSDRLEVAA